jgi:riboflavin biosynthesis pyrimidine reductase
MRVLNAGHDQPIEQILADHVLVPTDRPADRAFVRLNMISSADGGSAVQGVSGGLGNRDDHAVYQALRDAADGVVVGLGTVVAEHYHPPSQSGLHLYVVADRPDPSGAEELFASPAVTMVLPEDAGPAPAGVTELRAGTGLVDLHALLAPLTGQVLVLEGGPTLAGVMVSLGLVDEFFVTVSPRVVAGTSGRVTHGPDADPSPWGLQHGFCDDDGFLFLRYSHAG